MKRRLFLTLPLLCATVACAQKENSWSIIQSVQEHFFPQSKKYPSAKAFEATRYLKMVAYHDSFDKDDLDFILRGAEELKKRGYQSIMKKEEKERVLRAFSQTQFGENWLSLMLNYTIEALFSDPIYGGNKNEIGWSTFHHHAGVPRPKKQFGGLS